MKQKVVRASSISYWFFELVLILYLLHSVPVIGLLTPAALYAGIMVLLFVCAYFLFGAKSFFEYFYRTIPLSIVFYLDFIRSISLSETAIIADVYLYLQIVILLIIGQYIYFANDIRLAKHLYYILLIMYVATAVTTYLGCLVYPEAARDLATSISSEDPILYDLYRRLNIGGFSFIYTLVLIIPLLVGALKNRFENRILCVLIMFVFFFAIIGSQYTTALLLSVFSFFLLFASKKLNKRKSYILLIVSFFVIMIGKSILPQLLQTISSFIDSRIVASRLGDLSSLLSNDDDIGNIGANSDVDTRYFLMKKSWNTFLDSPLWGTWNLKAIGNHSYFLDNLALYGLLGLVAYLALWIGLYRLYWKNNEKKNWFGFFFFGFIFSMVLSFMNPHIFYTYLGFIVPVIMVIYKSKTTKP